ncbi:PKD domain-containing protein [Microbulbifer sp. TYP-18]|uniref:PKD domain-containing protein n=1 Tax=Microbulbifer sp. TYP-18 TaxID=3230024 RepID=UPI0034C68146
MGNLFSALKPAQFRRWFVAPSVLILLLPLSAYGAWWSPAFDVSIETTTNGEDADAPPGPEILLGSPVTWTYTVTNTGKATLRRVHVFDRAPGSQSWFGNVTRVCTIEKLKRGQSQTCTLEGVAKQGQYRNTGIAVAYGNRWWHWAKDRDSSHYLGTLGNPAVELEKATQGLDADSPPGPEINVGDPVNWSFVITNRGDVDLSNVVVTDQQVQPAGAPETSVCEIPILTVGQSHTCELSGTAIEGQYQNLAQVTAQGLGDSVVTNQDGSHYIGILEDVLAALPSAKPTSGVAPLSVVFTPNATTDNAIVRYQWDFEGDGVFERSETVGRNQSFTYRTPGNYDATLRVTDRLGEQATGSVLIAVGNQAPVVTVNLTPSNGQIPLFVTFSATATDSDGIAQFEWDFEGDGTFDTTTTTGSVSHTYTTEGFFQARLRVTDNLSAATTLTIPTLEVNALPTGSPTVTLVVSPATGRPPLNVNFTATASDPDGGGITQYEWDLDGDGTVDQTTTTGSLNFVYSAPGTFYPRVRVADTGGLQAEDAARIFVEPDLSLNVSIDTIDPLIGETVTIGTELGGDTEVSLVIEDRNGQQVRTLVPFAERAAGNYQDSWDGSDDAGQTVTEGEYRVILLYRVDGIVQRLDLALTSGGIQSNPPRSRIPSSFSPLAGDPLDITFTLNRASEVTAFMGLFNVNTRLVTFLQRQPLGRGSHQIVWNGDNADGQLIEAPPGDRFLFGIFAYTLPNNAIYVRSGVHVRSVSASPSIYQPTQAGGDISSNFSEIQVDLSRAGSARLVINDTESGATVAEFSYPGLSAGNNLLTWDGRDNNGDFVAPGTYRLGVSGIDETGYESLTVFALQRVFY